jgi:geranylgeranyl pyrophosphate synthase
MKMIVCGYDVVSEGGKLVRFLMTLMSLRALHDMEEGEQHTLTRD